MRSTDRNTIVFFFNDTATTEIYTLSLHDALPIYRRGAAAAPADHQEGRPRARGRPAGAGRHARPAPAPGLLPPPDRKSTRLNSSHANISYAVFCLKKKKLQKTSHFTRYSQSPLPS